MDRYVVDLFFFQAEDGIRDIGVTGVQTCALPILIRDEPPPPDGRGIARTGVTVLMLADDAFRRPLAAGGAVLNGAGECTGFLTRSEECRVGKECRSRWSPYHYKQNIIHHCQAGGA